MGELIVGDLWDEEFHWLADESIRALKAAGLTVSYQTISACAGVYFLSAVQST